MNKKDRKKSNHVEVQNEMLDIMQMKQFFKQFSELKH